MTNELRQFVKEGLNKGLSRAKLKEALKKGGWKEDEIASALGQFADVDFDIAVPRRKPGLSAREAFFYLVMFFTLYVSAFSLGTLFFQFINLYLPEAGMLYAYDATASYSTIRAATAALIITFPVFLLVARSVHTSIQRDPEKRSSEIRKWLTYLTLFVTAAIIIGDLITLVTYLLGGDATLRFLLKVGAVLLIAGSIFLYYLWDLRQEEKA